MAQCKAIDPSLSRPRVFIVIVGTVSESAYLSQTKRPHGRMGRITTSNGYHTHNTNFYKP